DRSAHGGPSNRTRGTCAKKKGTPGTLSGLLFLFGFSASAAWGRIGEVFFPPMDFTCRLEDWLSLRPVVVHALLGEVPQLGRNNTVREMGNHYVWLLRRGSVEVENEGVRIEAHAGDWVVAHPGPRRQKFSAE